MNRGWKVLLFVMAGMAGSLAAADFLPLAPGNSWTYRDAETGQTLTVEVGGAQFIFNGNVYHSLKGYTPARQYVRVNEYGNVAYWDEERQQEILLISFEIVPGAWFEAPARQCPEMGQPQEKRVDHDGPAGGWSALEIQYKSFVCADAGDLSEQFAENIGMVRRVVNTFAGPRTFDLVQARVGTQLITAGSAGRFSVSALPGPDLGSWTATLRIDQQPSSLLTLHFPSGQEYDARLRDSNGTILWTWSADKAFILVGHSRQLGTGWSASISVPFPPSIPEGPGTYTLEAWLTNVENEPQFAAAVTVNVPMITNVRALGRASSGSSKR